MKTGNTCRSGAIVSAILARLTTVTLAGWCTVHLEYATAVWSPHLIKHIDDLENVQPRATKQIPNFSSLSYVERLKKLHLPTLSYRRIRGDLIQVYKMNCKDCGYGNTLSSIFQPSQTKNLRVHSKNYS